MIPPVITVYVTENEKDREVGACTSIEACRAVARLYNSGVNAIVHTKKGPIYIIGEPQPRGD